MKQENKKELELGIIATPDNTVVSTTKDNDCDCCDGGDCIGCVG